MPTEYVHQSSTPLKDDISIGMVLDLETSHAYVRDEDLSRWGITFEDAQDQAAANLNDASADMAVQLTDGPDAFAVIVMNDGYDAARLLLPQIRAFLAAIPNRDFLNCWRHFASSQFQNFVRDKVANDVQQQPYPLTGEVLRVTRSSIDPALPLPPPSPI
ncbi:MAG: hypothetical protein ACTHQM_17210 [Thermoanaerobaculia bacterium]